MRKASREMDAAFALEVLDKAPYVTVSMTKSDGSPYGNVRLLLALKMGVLRYNINRQRP